MHKKVNDVSCLTGVLLNMFNSHTGAKVRRQMTAKVFRDESIHLTQLVVAIPPLVSINVQV